MIEEVTIQNNRPDITKSEELKVNLIKYGFFELPKVKVLSPKNQSKLFEKLNTNVSPYIIAMFDYLGFLKHLTMEYSMTKAKINDTIGKMLDIDPRTVKGNINVLTDYSEEKKVRYTSHKHKETVINDYNLLK